jgi:hypothetical protein
MQETTRSAQRLTRAPAGIGSPFGGDAPFAPTAEVRHGVYTEHAPANQTVGEIRRRMRDRLSLPDGAQAFVNGRPVDDATRVLAGMRLEFMHHAGEKGVRLFGGATRKKGGEGFSVEIGQRVILARSPEGNKAALRIEELADVLSDPAMDTGEAPLPVGVRYVKSRGGTTVWVHETPPSVWNLRWIADDSPKPFGGAAYRDVVLGLPYLVVLAVFHRDGEGPRTLTGANECFFRTAPLRSYTADELLVPALLNCSVFGPVGKGKIGIDGRPLVWICTEHLNFRRLALEKDAAQRMVKSLAALMQALLGTGFNLSSEHHEFSSGFTVSRGIDPRVDTVEAWQRATEEDPEFVLNVPWIKTGYTLAEAVERVFLRQGESARRTRSAQDLARLVFQRKAAQNGRAS